MSADGPSSGSRAAGDETAVAPSNGQAAGASPASQAAEMAQAFRDLARGEQQAAALEAHLTKLESKLDALLASVEEDATRMDDSAKEPSQPDEKEIPK